MCVLRVGGSQKTTWKWVLSSYHVGPGNWIRAWPALSAERSHWPHSPFYCWTYQILSRKKNCHINKRCLLNNLLFLKTCFMCISVLSLCVTRALCVCLVPEEMSRRHWMPQNWSYRWLCVAMWVLGTKPLRTVRALNHWAISLVPSISILKRAVSEKKKKGWS